MNATSEAGPLRALLASTRSGQTWLRLPFDVVRAQHARWVQTGLLRRSLLASGNFESALGAAERMVLGPFARRR